jgi:hypothetical protein
MILGRLGQEAEISVDVRPARRRDAEAETAHL